MLSPPCDNINLSLNAQMLKNKCPLKSNVSYAVSFKNVSVVISIINLYVCSWMCKIVY